MRNSYWSCDVCSSDLDATCTVTATGTQFQARVESGICTVTLLEGQVRVAAQDGEQQQVATLAPGERIAIQSTGLGQLQHIPEAALASARGWTEGSLRSEEHTSELQSLMRISYAVFCLKKKHQHKQRNICKYTKKQQPT